VSATDVIAVIALVGVIISLLLQFRESGRRNEEIGLLRAEAERRDEELQLLRQQVEAQQEEGRRHEQARLSVFGGVPADRRGGGIEYRVPVQNVGDAAASQIAVELVDIGGVKIGTSAQIASLVPGDKAYATVLTPSVFAGPYEIFFEWDDGRRDRNRAASGVQVGTPAS